MKNIHEGQPEKNNENMVSGEEFERQAEELKRNDKIESLTKRVKLAFKIDSNDFLGNPFNLIKQLKELGQQIDFSENIKQKVGDLFSKNYISHALRLIIQSKADLEIDFNTILEENKNNIINEIKTAFENKIVHAFYILNLSRKAGAQIDFDEILRSNQENIISNFKDHLWGKGIEPVAIDEANEIIQHSKENSLQIDFNKIFKSQIDVLAQAGNIFTILEVVNQSKELGLKIDFTETLQANQEQIEKVVKTWSFDDDMVVEIECLRRLRETGLKIDFAVIIKDNINYCFRYKGLSVLFAFKIINESKRANLGIDFTETLQAHQKEIKLAVEYYFKNKKADLSLYIIEQSKIAGLQIDFTKTIQNVVDDLFNEQNNPDTAFFIIQTSKNIGLDVDFTSNIQAKVEDLCKKGNFLGIFEFIKQSKGFGVDIDVKINNSDFNDLLFVTKGDIFSLAELVDSFRKDEVKMLYVVRLLVSFPDKLQKIYDLVKNNLPLATKEIFEKYLPSRDSLGVIANSSENQTKSPALNNFNLALNKLEQEEAGLPEFPKARSYNAEQEMMNVDVNLEINTPITTNQDSFLAYFKAQDKLNEEFRYQMTVVQSGQERSMIYDSCHFNFGILTEFARAELRNDIDKKKNIYKILELIGL